MLKYFHEMSAFLIISFLVSYLLVVSARCPNLCNGHGTCEEGNTCICFDGFNGGAADCSSRTCPYGVAWVDKAYADGAAHQNAECSNAGFCERATGNCKCNEGFTGSACQRTSCPSGCSGHGTCSTIRDLSVFEGPDYDHAVTNYGDGLGVEYNQWDKYSVTACKCDQGFAGPDCSQMLCPKGDDPLTLNQNYRSIRFTVFNEHQYAEDYVGLQFMGETVLVNVFDLSACSNALSNKGPFGTVGCVTSKSYASNLYQQVFTLTFYSWPTYPRSNNLYSNDGNPLLTAFHCDVSTIKSGLGSPYCSFEDIVTTDIREYVSCSNRGHCDHSKGLCDCVDGYGGPSCANATFLYTSDLQSTPGLEVTADGLLYSSSVLQLSASRAESPDFYFIEANAGGNSGTVFSVRGDGLVTIDHLKALKGGITIEGGGLLVTSGGTTITTGGLNVNSRDTSNSVTSINNNYLGPLSSTYSALHINTNTKSNTHYLLQASNQGTSMFNVAATGLVEITTGGLLVTGGVTVNGAGITVTGGATVRSGGLVVTRTGISVTGGFTVENEGFRVQEGGFEVFAGGFSIYSGGMVLNAGGMTITGSGLTVTGGVTINSGGLEVTGGMTVSSDGLVIDNSGITIKDGGLVVDTKGLTITSGGLKITTHGMTIMDGGIVVENGDIRILGGGLYVTGGMTVNDGFFVSQGLTVVDGGMRVNLAGLEVYNAGIRITGGMTISDHGVIIKAGGLTVTGGPIYAGNGVDVSGDVTVQTGGVFIKGGLVVTGGLTINGETNLEYPIHVFSDRRLKTNVTPITDALEKVSQLQGVYFNWIQNEPSGMSFDEDKHVGVIAQEVLDILPEAVEVGKDGGKYLGVDYSSLIPLLIEAIHDLEDLITDELEEDSNCHCGEKPTHTEDVLKDTYTEAADLLKKAQTEAQTVEDSSQAVEELSQMREELRIMHERNAFLKQEMDGLRQDIDELSKVSFLSVQGTEEEEKEKSDKYKREDKVQHVQGVPKVESKGIPTWAAEEGQGNSVKVEALVRDDAGHGHGNIATTAPLLHQDLQENEAVQNKILRQVRILVAPLTRLWSVPKTTFFKTNRFVGANNV